MPAFTPIAVDSTAARAAAGDPDAIAQLVQRWSGAIRRWTLAAMGDVVRADDVAQDALERLLKGLPSYDPHRPFEPWLRQVVRNTAIDHQRRTTRRREVDPVDTMQHLDPAHALDLDAGARRALAAFACLTERQRAVLIAVDHDGRSVAEVAAEFAIDPGTVRSVVCKARRAVRSKLLAERPELAALVGGA